MLTRKTFLRACAVLVAAATLTSAGTTGRADPVRGGTLVLSSDIEPKSMDPIMGDAGGGDRRVLNHI